VITHIANTGEAIAHKYGKVNPLSNLRRQVLLRSFASPSQVQFPTAGSQLALESQPAQAGFALSQVQFPTAGPWRGPAVSTSERLMDNHP
jgi:hypothetical protein